MNSFEFEAEAPSPEKIPAEDLLGVTVILLTASYKDAEFIRVGYYVNNEYESEEMRENPPEEVQLDKVQREVLASKPRVTRFNINWYAMCDMVLLMQGQPERGDYAAGGDTGRLQRRGRRGADDAEPVIPARVGHRNSRKHVCATHDLAAVFLPAPTYPASASQSIRLAGLASEFK